MSEGELKKKIIDFLDNDTDIELDGHQPFWDENGNIQEEPHTPRERITEILDEAKKDYALIDEFRYNKPGKPFMSQEEAREKWFRKWFGV